LTQAIRNELATARAPTLIQQIRLYNPTYQYQTIGPVGFGYTARDVRNLELDLQGYRSAGCPVPGAVPWGISPLPGTRIRPLGVPSGWRIEPTDTPGGTQYFDPTNRGNQVRVMQGDPLSPYPNSRTPYVRDLVNGQYRDVQGNTVPKNDPAGHIPLPQYRGYQR
jgi:hypothetical protein